MKKSTALAMILALLCLTACGGKTAPTVPPETQPAVTEAPTEAPTEAASAADAIGTFTDGVYENPMLAIRAAFDENWYVASDEERLELIGIMTAEVSDDAIAQALQDTGSTMDLYAVQQDGRSVNLMLEKINFLQGVLVSEEQYIQASLEQMPAALDALQMEDVEIEEVTVSFAGKEHPGLKISGVLSGMDFFEKLVAVKGEGYFGVVTASSYVEDTTDSTLALFTAR